MTMIAADQKVVVFRSPQIEGNFVYRLAELPDLEARRLEERLSRGEVKSLPANVGGPLTLVEVMEELDTRDFQVLDYPTHP